MARDTDYAAVAVNEAIVQKYGRAEDLSELKVVANDRTLTVKHGEHRVESTRDNLLAAIRTAASLAEFWQQFPASHRTA